LFPAFEQAANLELEELLTPSGTQVANEKLVKGYVEDLEEALRNSSLPHQKAFVHSFVKEVRVTGNRVLLRYTMPLTREDCLTDTTVVLAMWFLKSQPPST